MLPQWAVLQLVLALAGIFPLAADSQGTESYTIQPPTDWDEHPFTDNPTAAVTTQATIDSVTAGTLDPLDTGTPSVIPRGFDDRAVSTVAPVTAEPITISSGTTLIPRIPLFYSTLHPPTSSTPNQ